MTRHRFDPLSFAFGLAFLAFAGLLSFSGIKDYAPGLRWVGAGALLLLGVGMLFGSRKRDEDR